MFLHSPTELNYVPGKIISLVPSITELLYYFGLENETVGITKFCTRPTQWYETKTRVGGTKSLNLEMISLLNPDLIIANKEENNKGEINTLAEKFPVWLTDINDLPGALEMIRHIGILTRKENTALILTEYLDNLYSQLLKSSAVSRARVIYLIWKDPYMTIGSDTFINSMLNTGGYINIYSSLRRYPVITLEEIKCSDAEIIMLSSEPYPFKEKHLEEFKNAIPGKKVLLVDGEMFSWYGSRLLFAPNYFKNLRKEEESIKSIQ